MGRKKIQNELFHSLGACCVCRESERTRNLIMLDGLCPTPGRGWGCMVCGKEENGAIAVVCDDCLAVCDIPTDLKLICTGYPNTDGRTPYGEMKGSFQHDEKKHHHFDTESGCERN